jgi:hypothetical protein
MGILSSILNIFKSIFSKIFSIIKSVFAQLWPLLIIIALIYFAPVIASYFGSIGAPAFLVDAFQTLSLATPYLVSSLQWVIDAGASLGAEAWDAWKELDLATQVGIGLGTSFLLAPEETVAIVKDIADTVGTVVGGVASGLLNSPIGLGILAVGAFFLFGGQDGKRGPHVEVK